MAINVKYMKQKYLILQDSLSKIAVFIVGNDLSNYEDALKTLNNILKTFQIEEVNKLPEYNKDFEEHANNIRKIEELFIELGNTQHDSSNKVNALMSKFITSKE